MFLEKSVTFLVNIYSTGITRDDHDMCIVQITGVDTIKIMDSQFTENGQVL